MHLKTNPKLLLWLCKSSVFSAIDKKLISVSGLVTSHAVPLHNVSQKLELAVLDAVLKAHSISGKVWGDVVKYWILAKSCNDWLSPFLGYTIEFCIELDVCSTV